jgi:hypothetical protein
VYFYAQDYATKNVTAFNGGRLTATQLSPNFQSINWENRAQIHRIAIRTDNHPTDLFVAGSRVRIIGIR